MGGFQLSLTIPRKETEGSNPGWNQGDKPSDGEENPGSRSRQRLGEKPRPPAHSIYIHVKQE